MPILNMFNAFVEKKIKEIGALGKAIDIKIKSNVKIYNMYNNQRKVYIKLGQEKDVVLSEPTGSGKSMTIAFVFADKLTRDLDHKVLIAVPKTLIAKTFSRSILEYDDGRKIEWDMGVNLCQDIKEQKINRILRFLKKRKFVKGIHDRSGITTHLGLAISLSNKSDEEIVEYFKNTTLIIDEAHHVLYPDNGDTQSANILGRIISVLLEKGDPSTGIWLVTATFYRGDSGPILSNDQINKFKIHHLPFDQHWKENIKHIESFEFNFVTYDKETILNDISEILKRERKKTIIYCPYTGHLLKGKSKKYFKNKIIYTVKDIWPNAKICDLVKIHNRDKQKEILFDDLTANDIDAILTVRIFDEGSDWKYAELAIDLMPSSSLRVQVQRLGRLWRDIPGKNHISYYVFLPHRTSFKDDEDRRKHFSDSYNALAGSMIIHEIVKPIIYPGVKQTTIDDQTINALDMAIPDLSKRQELLKDIKIELVKFRNIKEPTIEETKEKIREMINEKYQIEDKDFSITNQILGMIKRAVSSISNNPLKPTWKNQGIDLTWMKDEGYDKIELKDMYNNLLMFGTLTAGVETFEQFREVYGNKKSIPEWVSFAEELAEKNNGILYSHRTLIDEMGLVGLSTAIYNNPDAFKHIPQENKSGRTIKTTVKIAEELAKTNNNILPKDNWLRNNGFNFIFRAKTKYPEKFSHINQDKHVYQTINSVKKTINSILKENNGKLYDLQELKKRGLGYIYSWLMRYPKEFKHIKREFGKKTKKYWSKFAITLEKKEGAIPTSHELKKRGLSALDSMITKYPHIFKGRKQYFGQKKQIRIIGEDNA